MTTVTVPRPAELLQCQLTVFPGLIKPLTEDRMVVGKLGGFVFGDHVVLEKALDQLSRRLVLGPQFRGLLLDGVEHGIGVVLADGVLSDQVLENPGEELESAMKRALSLLIRVGALLLSGGGARR